MINIVIRFGIVFLKATFISQAHLKHHEALTQDLLLLLTSTRITLKLFVEVRSTMLAGFVLGIILLLTKLQPL